MSFVSFAKSCLVVWDKLLFLLGEYLLKLPYPMDKDPRKSSSNKIIN